MVESESLLGKAVELLKKLQSGEAKPRQARAPDRQQKVTQYLEKRVAKEQAKEQTGKLVSSDRETQKEAIKTVRQDTYNSAELQTAKTDVQTVPIGDIPSWFKDGAGNLQAFTTEPAAKLAIEIARLPQDLKNNPDVLYGLAARTYWSTKWTELPSAQEVREVREAIDATIQHALDLAAQDPRGNHRILEAGEDGLWRGLNNKFDLYRTERIPEPKQSPSTLDAELKNRQSARLDSRLRRAQEYFDARNLSPQEERRELQKLAEEFGKGMIDKSRIGRDRTARIEQLYNKDHAQQYIQKVETRIEELSRELEAQRMAGRPSRRVSGRQEMDWDELVRTEVTPDIVEAELKGLLPRIKSTSLRELATLVLNKRGELGIPEWQAIYRELGLNIRTSLLDEVRDRIVDEQIAKNPALKKSDVAVLNADLQKEAEADKKAIGILDRMIRGEFLRAKDFVPTHSHWNTHQDHLERMRTFEYREYFHNPASGNPAKALEDLDEIFFDILSVADRDPRGSFRESVNLYVEADIEAFYGLLKKRLSELKAGNPTMTDRDIQHVLERYTNLRNAKEIAHNLVYISHVGDMELLGKFAGSLLSGDVDFMYHNIPGIQLAQHIREAALVRLEADYGYLPSDAVSGDKNAISLWEEMADKEMKVMLEHGLLGQQGEEMLKKPWKIKNALEFASAIDIVDLRLSDMITRSKDAADFASKVKEKLGLDPIHGLFLKYKTQKPMLAILYFLVSGDEKGATSFFQDSNWSLNKMIDMYYQAQVDPRFAHRIADIKNFADISGRFGLRSMWGVRRAGEMMSEEEYQRRGIGLRIADAGRRAGDHFEVPKKKELEATHGKNDPRVGRELLKYMNDHDIQKEIAARKTAEIKNALQEGLDKLPLVFVRRMRAYEPWEETRFVLLEKLLTEPRTADSARMEKILQGGAFGHITELAKKYPANKGGDMARPEDHLKGAELQKVKDGWSALMEAYDEVEGDLSLAQQHAVTAGHTELNPEDYNTIQDGVRRERAKRYAELIKEAAMKPQKISEKPEINFVDFMTERYDRGIEKFLFTTEDTPYASFEWSRMGDRGVLRGILDAQAAMKGIMGLVPYTEAMTAEPKHEELVDVMRKEIFNNLAAYDDTAAQEFCGVIAEQTIRYFGEKDWASYSGVLGDLLSMRLFSDWAHSHGWYGLMTSMNRAIGDPTGEAWGPNERWRFVHQLNGRHVLAKDTPLTGWTAGHKYTAHSIEKRTGSEPVNAVMEYVSYVPATGFIMMGQAAKDESEEQKRS